MGPMAGECVLLAIPLIVLSLFLNTQFNKPANPPLPPDPTVASVMQQRSIWRSPTEPGRVSGSALFGITHDQPRDRHRGRIYEELVFRLILICLLVVFFQDLLRTPYTNALILSVFISAASLARTTTSSSWKAGSGRNSFTWTEFGFRTAAGVYFSVLFAVRGFGITAGTHVFYDIIATVLNAVFFAA